MFMVSDTLGLCCIVNFTVCMFLMWLPYGVITKLNYTPPVAAGEGEGGIRRGRHWGRGRHLYGRKYGILKFGRFWQIAICIADNDIYTP